MVNRLRIVVLSEFSQGTLLRQHACELTQLSITASLERVQTQHQYKGIAYIQESIKTSSRWYLACRSQAAGMANMMLHRVQQIPDFPAQLHILYLINDILFATCVHTLLLPCSAWTSARTCVEV